MELDRKESAGTTLPSAPALPPIKAHAFFSTFWATELPTPSPTLPPEPPGRRVARPEQEGLSVATVFLTLLRAGLAPLQLRKSVSFLGCWLLGPSSRVNRPLQDGQMGREKPGSESRLFVCLLVWVASVSLFVARARGRSGCGEEDHMSCHLQYSCHRVWHTGGA